MSDTFDRQPPFSIEAETAVLAAMVQSKDAIEIALERLRDGMFYRESNRRVFRAIVKIWERGALVDPVTLGDQLKTTGELDSVGGIDFIASLIDSVPNAVHVEHHTKIVKEKAQLRRLIEASSVTIRDVYDQGERSVNQIIGEAETRILALGEATGGDYVRVKERIMPVFEELEDLQARRRENPDTIPGISTGLKDLDRKILGYNKGDFIVIAARPSMGKTAAVMTGVLNATISEQIPTLVFSLEMSVDALVMRSLASEARVDLHRLRRGDELKASDNDAMGHAAGRLSLAPLFIDDSPDVGLASVMGRIRRGVKRDGIGLVVIDYIQLMTGIGDNRTEQVNSISRACKATAKALDIPIIGLSQLNRAVDGRSDKRPMLSDLRASGGIEEDSDVVIFLYRPDYYMTAAQIAKLNGEEGLTEMIVAKQRNGPTGTVRVHFEKKSTRFESLARGGPKESFGP